jgi:peptide/nickel transport system ATP-binding protein
VSGLDEQELRRLRGDRIGIVFQDPLTSLNPTMTIGDQVGEPLRIHRGASDRTARARRTRTRRR